MELNQLIIDETYQIIGEIGSGGGGIIYKAYHLRLQKYVVIKKIKDSVKGKIDLRGEADILKRLHHPYLPQVYDFVTVADDVYTVIDYIEGKSFDVFLSNGYTFSQPQVIKWGKQLAEVLNYLHNQKPAIIHSDIKPANIMLRENGDICLIDFNISYSGEGDAQAIGKTDGYSPPEQYIQNSQMKQPDADMRSLDSKNDDTDVSGLVQPSKSNTNRPSLNYYKQIDLKIDERSDIYSFGATLYHLYSGKRPNKATENVISIRALCPNISEGLEYIIMKSLSKNPSERFQSAKELSNVLNHIYKWDQRYKQRRAKENLFLLIYSLSLSFFIIMTVLGFRVLKVEKDDRFDAAIQSAEAALEEGNLDEAIEYASEANKLFPNYPESYYWHGMALFESQNFDACVTYLSDIVNLSFNESKLKETADLQFLMGNALLELESYPSAVTFYEKAIELNQDNPEYYRDLAIALGRLDRIEEAQKVVEIAKNKHIDEASLEMIEGELDLRKGNFEGAAGSFEKAFSLSEDDNFKVRASAQAAECYEALGQYDNAIHIVMSAIDSVSETKNLVLYEILGANYFNLGLKSQSSSHFQLAVEAFIRLIERGYNPYYIQHNVVLCYQYMGNYLEAESLLLNLIQEYPDEYQPVMQLSFLQIEMQSKLDSSAKDYTQAYAAFLKAKDLYEKQNQEDAQMYQLDSLIDDLIRNSWIKP